MTDSEDTFRRFAIEVYRTDGVSPAALMLQDRCGVDVNVLLLAAYVGAARRRSLSRRDLEEVQHRVGKWQHDVVGPLRALRHRLKDGPPPAPTAVTAVLRDRIKEIELDAEMIELDELATLASGFDGPSASGPPSDCARAAMTVVVGSSAGREPTVAEYGAIAVIANVAGLAGRTS